MFIVAKKSFGVRRADGTLYRIPNGFIGNIPEEIAKAPIVKLALKDGSIVKSESKKDAAIDKAVNDAAANVAKDQADKEDKKNKEDSKKDDSKAD